MTTMTETHNAATAAQMNFINDLIASRQMTDDVREGFTAMVNAPSFDKKQASMVIDTLKMMPKATKPAATATKSPMMEALSLVPKARYAVPAEEVDVLLTSTPVTGDLLFIEVREYNGHLYMRRLTGAPGGFSRWKMANDDVIALAKHIATDSYKYTKLFGEHYSCCGKCGAELTDPLSRQLLLGPTCRQAFGL